MIKWRIKHAILSHRYCYYVLSAPTISDRDYDKLEKQYVAEFGDGLGVGSDNPKDYPEAIRKEFL